MTSACNILERFSGVRRSGDGWVARCPAHEDRKASLSIHGRDEKVLIHCHAGCSPEEVCRAAGIEIRDLFLDESAHKLKPASKVAKRVVSTYDYLDEKGALIFQVCRFEPKDFRQRRPDGQGDWIWNLEGVQRVLYRLPEVLAASEVLTVEGEKDAETGHSLGFVATCNPGGAGKWRSEYTEALASKDVIVIPDADEAGRRHAQQVLTSMTGKARSLKVVELTGVKDLTEWVERGGTREQLVDLIRSASEWTLPDGMTLLSEVVDLVRSYVYLSPAQAMIVALWVFHTHALSAADATPYISITSVEKQSGKSRLLEVLELLVAEPWLTGRVTAAVLVRKIDKSHPTLLLDESDAAFKENDEYSEALRGVLNTGHRRSGRASCCVGQGASIDFKDFDTFCPKALAGIGRLPDTVADRSLPIRLKRRTRGEEINRFRRRKAELEAKPIKQRILAWAAGAAEKLRIAEPDLPEGLTDRQQDCAEPLIAIADSLGANLPQRARAALLELFSTGPEDDDQSVGVRLLQDLRAIFEQEEPTDRLASEALVEKLAAIETSPWAEWNRGKPVTKVQLARLLKRFGITPRTIRLQDGTTPKGYLREDFCDSWERYLPSSPSPHSGLPNATTPQSAVYETPRQISKRHAGMHVADLKTEETPVKTGSVADVAFRGSRHEAEPNEAHSTDEIDNEAFIPVEGHEPPHPRVDRNELPSSTPALHCPEPLPEGCEVGGGENDPVYERAVQLATGHDEISISLLKEQLGITTPRAVQLIDHMEQHGIVGPAAGSGPRKALRRTDPSGLAPESAPFTGANPNLYQPEPLPGGGWRCECGVEGNDPVEWSKHTGEGGCPLKASPFYKPSKHNFGKAQRASRREGRP